MPANNAAYRNTIAKTILSPREMDVAMLARLSLGRNAISQTLGLSANSVKTILKRIEAKLGPHWKQNSRILWPEPDAVTAGETAATEGTNHEDDFENGYYHRLERELRRQWEGRRLSMRLLLARNRAGRDVLHVTSSQRFWLRPVLAELEDRKYLKLLAVDWNETFAPAWLPLVYRGRTEVRAADYATDDARHVTSCINNYLQHRLHDYILGLNTKLEEVRRATRHKYKSAVPELTELTALALADLPSHI